MQFQGAKVRPPKHFSYFKGLFYRKNIFTYSYFFLAKSKKIVTLRHQIILRIGEQPFKNNTIMLANLDNGTIFKKAFTDIEVFEQFIKDVLGFEVKISKIETEKKFEPKIGRIAFELDIFAETEDHRMVIELQKVEYDYNFDRFLHYFLMLIAEQQKRAKEYTIKRTVYLILIMTEPYEVLKDLNGNLFEQEMIVTTLHTEDSGHDNVPLYPHKFIALNPNHKHAETPQAIRDWLDLIYESVNNPENPKINRQNKGIDKAANLIDMDNLTSEETEEKKKGEAAKTKRELYEEKTRQEEQIKIARQLHKAGVELNVISTATKIPINELLEVLENE